MTQNSYISIAIMDETKEYVAIESISVMKSSCVLSGAWILKPSESFKKEMLLANKLILNISTDKHQTQKFGPSLDLSDFLNDAAREARIAIEEFTEFVAFDPKKRKNLVQPNFFEWPEEIDLNNLDYYESFFKIKMDFENSQPEIRRVLSVAKLVQHLIKAWQLDEQERNNRRYLDDEQTTFTLLPPSWARLAS